MGYALATLCALANALASIFERLGVEDAPREASLRPSLLTHALRRGVWLLGFALLIASFLMQAVALHLESLTSVQPILTAELPFMVLVLALWFRIRVGPLEWSYVLLTAGGLAGFLYFASPVPGTSTPSGAEWVEVGGACAGAVALSVLCTRFGPRWWRAFMFGLAAAVAFAFTASLTKVTTDVIARQWTAMFSHWQTYALAVCGVLAVFLTQNAYHAGPLAASQSAFVVVEPLVSILIGTQIFDDTVRTSQPWASLEAISLVALFTGATMLCRSPLVTGVRGEGAEYEEMLSARGRDRVLRERRSAERPVGQA